MYNTSDRYKEAVYAPARTAKARVTFDISDVTAAGDVTSITTTSQAVLSNKAQLINKNREQYNFASFEPDRFKLDGSFMFADENIANNGELGFVSDILSGADGSFATPPALTFQFGSNHSSMGLTITFDPNANEYATDFTMTAYDVNNNVIDSVSVTGNDKAQVTPIGQLYQYRKITVVIHKWCKPQRRARVAEVDFGVVRVYKDNNLIKASLIEEFDIITSTIPSPEFKFTVDNANREFNILNPAGFYKFLQERQQVIPEVGIDTGGLIEYIPLGNYLLTEWVSDEGSLTATFTARTNLDLMSGFDYENLIEKSSYNLYQMAVEIFNLCGISNYYLDLGLQNISTKGLVENANCRDVLQMIAIAGCANIYVTRDNTITVKICTETLGNSQDEIDMDNMYSEPQIELDKVVKSVLVTYYSDLDTKQTVGVDNIGITKGDVLKVETNTLINNEAHAVNVANWILRQRNYRAKYSINWRGNPAHELNDIALIDNTYGTPKKAIITKNSIEYQGYLSAKTEARGLTDVVD
jgi:hypothetical protein